MKTYLLSFFVLIGILGVSNSTVDISKKSFKAPKGYVYIPSGKMAGKFNLTVNSFFMSDHEVTNKEYNAFLSHLKKQNRLEDYAKAQRTTTNWKSVENSAPMEKLYHSHKSYAKFPVVNISKEAAWLYCKWKNEKYKDHKNFTVNFRLPVEFEWVYAAQSGSDVSYGWGKNELKNKKGQYYANFEHNDKKEGLLMASSKSYAANGFGLYNMSGNVAEFTSSLKTIKGGSWIDKLEALEIHQKNDYEETGSPYVGFRPVITVMMKKK
ncbi:MAG: formylglycine-generating enzyme family protein [Saprospiraceae bacterium]